MWALCKKSHLEVGGRPVGPAAFVHGSRREPAHRREERARLVGRARKIRRTGGHLGRRGALPCRALRTCSTWSRKSRGPGPDGGGAVPWRASPSGPAGSSARGSEDSDGSSAVFVSRGRVAGLSIRQREASILSRGRGRHPKTERDRASRCSHPYFCRHSACGEVPSLALHRPSSVVPSSVIPSTPHVVSLASRASFAT